MVAEARAGLEALQQPDGHWVFELEADATIPAEYVLLEHFLGEIDQALEDKIARLPARRAGGPRRLALYPGGDFDLSATVKAYYALKLIGDDPEAPHMARARAAILAHGGAARCNVFTRITLALFGQVPWRAVPVMPVEIMLLPRWFPFHLDKVSYWSRTVHRAAPDPDGAQAARAQSARRSGSRSCSSRRRSGSATTSPIRPAPTGDASSWRSTGSCASPSRCFPRRTRQRAMRRAVAFVTERLNGEDGLGGDLSRPWPIP